MIPSLLGGPSEASAEPSPVVFAAFGTSSLSAKKIKKKLVQFAKNPPINLWNGLQLSAWCCNWDSCMRSSVIE